MSVVSFCCGLGLGLAGTLLITRSRPAPQTSISSSMKGFDLPRNQQQVLQLSDTFALGYNNRLKISTWAYERLTKESIQGDAVRKNRFISDKAVIPQFRSSDSDYKNSGFDRGHLVPAADLKSSQESMDKSFRLSNIAPQDPWLNRGYWADVEKFVRELCNTFDEVHTDPDNWVKYKLIGDNQVAVPTHFYKVIAARNLRSNRTYVGAFCVPNKKIPDKTSLKRFVVPVAFIEQFSGHLMFPELLHRIQANSGPQPHAHNSELIKDVAVKAREQRSSPKAPEELCNHVKCEIRRREMEKAIHVVRRTQTAE